MATPKHKCGDIIIHHKEMGVRMQSDIPRSLLTSRGIKKFGIHKNWIFLEEIRDLNLYSTLCSSIVMLI